jgi:hypothetical protein
MSRGGERSPHHWSLIMVMSMRVLCYDLGWGKQGTYSDGKAVELTSMALAHCHAGR